MVDVLCERKFIALIYRKKCSIGNSIGWKNFTIHCFKNCIGGKIIVLTYRKKFSIGNSIGGRAFEFIVFT